MQRNCISVITLFLPNVTVESLSLVLSIREIGFGTQFGDSLGLIFFFRILHQFLEANGRMGP